MRRRFLIAGGICLCFCACTVGHQIKKVPLEKGTSLDQAAYYALPRTVVTASFPVKQSFAVEGKGQSGSPAVSCFNQLETRVTFKDKIANWARFEPEILKDAIGLTAIPPLGENKYSLTGDPTIGTLAEPDPDQVFRVELSTNWSQKRELNLQFGPLGTLQAGTSFVQDRRVDLAAAFAKTVINILSADLAPKRAFGASLTLIDSSTSAGRPSEFQCDEVEDNCQRAACEIFSGRAGLERLPRLVAADIIDADSAAWLTKRLEDDIEARLPLFVIFRERIGNVVCAVRPRDKTEEIKLLEMSEKEGFRAASSESECLIPPGFEPKALSGIVYTMRLKVPEQLATRLQESGLDRAHQVTEDQGFYYRIPATASISIEKDCTKVAEGSAVVAQLGLVAALPRQRTYQTKYQIKLDPQTGALIDLTSNSEAVDPALITGTGDAIAGYLKKENELDEKEAAAKDELAQLERQRKILEEQYKIQDLQKKLAGGGAN